LRFADQSLALHQQSSEFRFLVSDATGDAFLICRAGKGGSLLYQGADE
jgi:hypothetical protein